MIVILVMVQTVNGKITKGNDPNIYSWTSQEDADFFFQLLKKHTLIVMGSGTYEAVKENIRPRAGQLRIVLTSNPAKYQKVAIPTQLEFHSVSPEELIRQMEKKGFDTMLLVGGGEVNKAFFQAHLIDELYLTVEPEIFGSGKHMIKDGDFTQKLRLISFQKLNEQGTLLLHYVTERAE